LSAKFNFDPRQLEAFEATVQAGTLSGAAGDLNLTLAAVSLRLKALEESCAQRLLVRGKTARPTAAGQALLAHIKQVRLLEADLNDTLRPDPLARVVLNVAVNADSLTSWFIPGVQAILTQHNMLLQTIVDDQDHTHQWLANGDVIGCVTTVSKPFRACVAEPLGAMRYRCVAAPRLVEQLGKDRSIHALLKTPAVCFNRKDGLQDLFLAQHFGLKQINYPRHYFPAVDAFHYALVNGLGWGMEADIQDSSDFKAKRLIDLFPGKTVSVPLYWLHWAHEAPAAARLSLAIKAVN
jgi:LysR family transcriptional regulator, chromosome initiation inhibitor